MTLTVILLIILVVQEVEADLEKFRDDNAAMIKACYDWMCSKSYKTRIALAKKKQTGTALPSSTCSTPGKKKKPDPVSSGEGTAHEYHRRLFYQKGCWLEWWLGIMDGTPFKLGDLIGLGKGGLKGAPTLTGPDGWLASDKLNKSAASQKQNAAAYIKFLQFIQWKLTLDTKGGKFHQLNIQKRRYAIRLSNWYDNMIKSYDWGSVRDAERTERHQNQRDVEILDPDWRLKLAKAMQTWTKSPEFRRRVDNVVKLAKRPYLVNKASYYLVKDFLMAVVIGTNGNRPVTALHLRWEQLLVNNKRVWLPTPDSDFEAIDPRKHNVFQPIPGRLHDGICVFVHHSLDGGTKTRQNLALYFPRNVEKLLHHFEIIYDAAFGNRKIPLTPTKQHPCETKCASGENLIFVNWYGTPAPMDAGSEILKEIRRVTGLKDFTMKTFRKSLATNMAADPVMRQVQSSVMGHSKQVIDEYYDMTDVTAMSSMALSRTCRMTGLATVHVEDLDPKQEAAREKAIDNEKAALQLRTMRRKTDKPPTPFENQ